MAAPSQVQRPLLQDLNQKLKQHLLSGVELPVTDIRQIDFIVDAGFTIKEQPPRKPGEQPGFVLYFHTYQVKFHASAEYLHSWQIQFKSVLVNFYAFLLGVGEYPKPIK